MADGRLRTPSPGFLRPGARQQARWTSPATGGEKGVAADEPERGLVPVRPAAPVCHGQLLRGPTVRALGRQAPATDSSLRRPGAGLPSRKHAGLGRSCARCRHRPIFCRRQAAQCFGDMGGGRRARTPPIRAIAQGPGALASTTAISFMCGPYVLLGASCVTPKALARNLSQKKTFFYPHQRWQFPASDWQDDA